MSNPQGTTGWHQDRLGKKTGSKVKSVLSKTKAGAWASDRKDYMYQLLCERVSGVAEDIYISKEMKWGTDNEPMARERYKDLTGYGVLEVGFQDHPDLVNCGASPDGIAEVRGGRDGLVEIKCPKTSTHIENMARGSHDPQYEAQMTLQMLCTLDNPWENGGWCDMVSYDPRLPAPLDICINRYHFDPAFAKELEDGIRLFEEELNGTVLAFLARFPDLQKDYKIRWMGAQ